MMTTARGGGERSRPAAYVPGRTANRRRPAAAAIPGPHAVTIQQTAADADRGRPKPAEIVKSEAESGRNALELAKTETFVYILVQYGKESTPAAGAFPAKSGGNDRHRHPLDTPRAATRGGRFTNRKSKTFPPCYATLPPASMFPTPAHQSAFLKQVTGKLGVGGWF